MSTEDIGGGLSAAAVDAAVAQGGWEEAKPAPRKTPLAATTLDTMPGNALLALTGVKTLYVGFPQDVTPGQFAWVQTTAKVDADGCSKTIRVPVIIDGAAEKAPRAKLSAEELKAAGYTDEQGLAFRLKSAPHYIDRLAAHAGSTDPLTSADAQKLFFDTAPASRITFHVATPAELKALAAEGSEVPSVKEAYHAVKDAIADLRAAEQLGRQNITDAVDFAKAQGVDLTRAKLDVQNAYASEAAIGRSAA
ncbi:MAG: hypothetical protein DI582_05120 [Azospirillum brasilense]|nr:MAG: hypothetical protein DI582_05120 [Azospirillum brasilense]